ncbi:hypothetical protein ACHAPQ_011563 [Fusarium lateritium]
MDVQETAQSTGDNPNNLLKTTKPDKIVFYCTKCRDEFRGPGADVRFERHPACEAKSIAQTGVLLPAEFDKLKKAVIATSGNDDKWQTIWATLYSPTSTPTQDSEAETVAPIGVDVQPHNPIQHHAFAGVVNETHHHDLPHVLDPQTPDFAHILDQYLRDDEFLNPFRDHQSDMANSFEILDHTTSQIPNFAPINETTMGPGRFDPGFVQNPPFSSNTWAQNNYRGTQ